MNHPAYRKLVAGAAFFVIESRTGFDENEVPYEITPQVSPEGKCRPQTAAREMRARGRSDAAGILILINGLTLEYGSLYLDLGLLWRVP